MLRWLCWGYANGKLCYLLNSLICCKLWLIIINLCVFKILKNCVKCFIFVIYVTSTVNYSLQHLFFRLLKKIVHTKFLIVKKIAKHYTQTIKVIQLKVSVNCSVQYLVKRLINMQNSNFFIDVQSFKFRV